ncbi:DMT family transporter [Dactylosporangium sp. NBC_01737]|uniref:EamA family transporter n=1 Tax=Dactylosporangium sp. NBC_01737 TaxID=2975959 RepID=UPI002E15E548|nr:DMT family transporter [Dactylosporangium sp. NBC_01737]
MIGLVLAALSGLVWGVGDFAGGKASQRVDAVTVVVLSKAASIPLLLIYLVLMPAPLHLGAVGWGAAAGVFGVAGMMVFYKAMAGGAMTVVAPVSAVTTALLPLGAGLLQGERPGGLALTGAACAIAAIGLVSLAPGGGEVGGVGGEGGGVKVTGRLIGLALAAGAAFGLFFICLSGAGDAADAAGGDAGMWPILGAQVAAVGLGAPLLLRRRGAPRPSGVPLRWLLTAGMLDMTANALYIMAVQRGDLSIIAPVASLYPVSTVLLAMLVDRERLRPVQLAGLGLAATALVLVAS